MSHHQHVFMGSRSAMPLKPPPPPPMMKDMHPTKGSNGGGGRYRRSRSRSRSPAIRRGSRTRHDDARPGGFRNSRERRRTTSRRSRSGSLHKRSSSARNEEPTSSSSYPTYIGNAEDARRLIVQSQPQQQINRIPPVDPNDNTIVRTILNPESVKIPRRENEGIRPIFDREELRDAIKRRMETGDNEQNPNPEQRVVAIIREPLQMAPQFMPQEIIPILPTQYMPEHMIQPQPQMSQGQGRFETSSGVPYGFSKEMSRSPARQEPRAEKSRDSGRGSEKRGGERRMRQESGDGFVDRRPRRLVARPRSRSPSLVARVDRVRTVRSFPINSGSCSPERDVGEGINLQWNDLRQCLNVHRNDRIQLAKAHAAERQHEMSPGRGGPSLCWHCGKTGHNRDNCRHRAKEVAEAKAKVGATTTTSTPCIYCRKMGHYSENCWFKNSRRSGSPPRMQK